MMDAELKAKWIEALRSGKYQQAEGSLHDQGRDSYCCLGVLCKVAGANFEDVDGVGYVPVLGVRVLSDECNEELSKSVCNEFGIPNQTILIEMNDGKGDPAKPDHKPSQPFSVIADFIEANL